MKKYDTMKTLSPKKSKMTLAKIIVISIFLTVAYAVNGQAGTIFNGELYAEFASPVGATFRLFHQGTLVALNADGYIDFGDLSYNSAIGLWVPSQMCSNPFTHCYRLTINMEPFGVMGDFDLNFQYVNTNNPNANAGAPYAQQGGLGQKVAATFKNCETLPGNNGTLDCFDRINFGGTNTNHAIMLSNMGYADASLNNTTDYYQLEFFVNTFNPNFPIWNIGQPAKAFTNLDHYGDYNGILTVTATYN